MIDPDRFRQLDDLLQSALALSPAQREELLTLVLAEFTNTTGDPVFDETLRQGLSVQLRQSPFLSLIPDERVRRTLTAMDQSMSRRPQVRVSSAPPIQGKAIGPIDPAG